MILRYCAIGWSPGGKSMHHMPQGVDKYYCLLRYKGSVKLTAGGKEYLVRNNDIILFEKGYERTFNSIGEPYTSDYMRFAVTESEDRFIKSLNIPLNEPFEVLSPSFVSESVKQALYEKQLGGTYIADLLDHRIKLTLLRLTQMIDLSRQPAFGSPHYEVMHQLRSDISNNPQKKWRVNEEAKNLCLSLSHFQHTFKNIIGLSFTEEVIRARIRRARELLIETPESLEEIGENCGFSDVFAFIKQFKSIVGVPPGEYRKKFGRA